MVSGCVNNTLAETNRGVSGRATYTHLHACPIERYLATKTATRNVKLNKTHVEGQIRRLVGV